jgi:hypothetical protein
MTALYIGMLIRVKPGIVLVGIIYGWRTEKNSFFVKMLLMWPGLDRCSTVGFRCAADIKS